jgi:hypothetical protein
MTPKEKSIELHSRFMKPVDDLHKYPMCFDTAKQCALICVDEIIKTCPQKENEIFAISKGLKFWKEVKKEIEKLV